MAHKLIIKRVLGTTPVKSHGGWARAVYWTLELNDVAISEENTRYLWSDDTSKIPDEPSSLAHLKTRIREGLDATRVPHADLAYLVDCVREHANKFPVPEHMRRLCDRIAGAIGAEADRRVPRFEPPCDGMTGSELETALQAANEKAREPDKWLRVGGLVLWEDSNEFAGDKGYATTVLALYDRTADVRLVGMMNADGLGPCDRHVLISELAEWTAS